MPRANSQSRLRTVCIIASACLGALATVSPSRGNTTANWLAPVSGNWTDATKWSTNPNYPNNGTPAGTAYDALIDATGAPYEVSLWPSSATLSTLTLNSTDATLDIGGGSGFNYGNSLSVQNALNLSDGTIRISGPTSGGYGSFLLLGGGQTINGNGQIIFDTGSYDRVGSPVDDVRGLTIGSGIKIATGSGNGTVGTTNAPLWNQGVLSAETSGALRIIGSNFINTGQIQIGNNGSFSMNAATSTAGLGKIVRNGGSFYIGGVVDNRGSTFDTSLAGGDIWLDDGTIRGGTIQATAGHYKITSNGATFDDVTINSNVDLSGASTLSIQNGLTISSGATVSLSNVNLAFNGTPGLQGSGNLVINAAPGGFGAPLAINVPEIDPNITLATGEVDPSQSGALVNLTMGTNYGKILAKTPGIAINLIGTDWKNLGEIRVTDDTLYLGGTFTTDALGDFGRNGGSVIVTGTIDNTNATLALNASTGSFEFGALSAVQPAIEGGTITSSDSAGLIVRPNTDLTLDNVVLDAPLTVNGSSAVDVNSGLTLNSVIHLSGGTDGALAQLRTNGPLSSTGNGQIVFDVNQSNRISCSPTTGGLTIGPGVTISTGTGGGSIVPYQGSFTNFGTISATTPGNSIALYGPFDNEGIVEARNGGSIILNSGYTNAGVTRATEGGTISLEPGLSNTGSLLVEKAIIDLHAPLPTTGSVTITDSDINVGITLTPAQLLALPLAGNSPGVIADGVIDASGTTLNINAATGSLRLAGGELTGGSITTSDGAVLRAISGVSTVNNTDFNGNLDVTGGTLNFTATNNGVINVTGGTLLLTGDSVNNGTISLDSATLALGGTFDSTILQHIQRTGGTVQIGGVLQNAGRVFTIDDNGAWELAGGTISGGTVAATNNAVLNIAPGATPSALDSVTLSSDVMLSPGATLYLSNGLTLQKSTVAVDGDLICQGTQTISGAGTFIFNGSAGPDGSPSGSATPLWYLNTGRIYPTSGVMTIGTGISIKTGQGDGIIGQSGTTINQGTISSITSGRSINLLGNFINQGTISVANGGVLAAANHLLGPGGFTNDGGTVNVEQGSVFNCGGKLVLTNGVIGGDGDVVASVGATVNGAVTKPGAGVIDVHSPGLTLAQDAQLNLTVGKLIARAPAAQLGTWNGATYTDLTGLIQSGRNGGTWDGPGIMTSHSNGGDHNEIGIATASQALGISATQTGTWMGQSVNGSDVLVIYTYGGDANLDGKINIDDYGRIDASVGQSGSVFGWYNGDFNYDGKINIDDYGIIDSNIGSQGPPLGIASDQALAGIAQADGITAVPEPSALLLLALPLLTLQARRRRRFFKI